MLRALWPLLRQAVGLYWLLIKIVLPVMVLTRLAVEAGIVDVLAPLLAPLMTLMGLPPELGIAWVTCLLVGIWAGAAAAFTVVSADSLTAAQVTVFASLMLFAHALPIEQRIAQKAGAAFWATTALRLLAAVAYGMILHNVCRATGWLSEPVNALWVPIGEDPGWVAFVWDTAQSLAWMFVILVGLVILLRVMEVSGLTRLLTVVVSPLLRLAGIGRPAVPLTMVGLLLGLSYGGGLIIQQAREGRLNARDVFLSVSLMGLLHSVVEDTLVVVSFGADLVSVLVGRVVFSLLVVVVLARAVALMPDASFFRFLFDRRIAGGRPDLVKP